MSRSRSALLEVIARLSTNNVTRDGDPEDKAGSMRLLRWALHDLSGQLLPKERIAVCMRRMIPTRKYVEVMYTPKYKRANYRNLMVCGSVWHDPICSAKITERRRVEVEDVIDELPYAKAMVTFTIQHKLFETLGELYGGLSMSYSDLKEGGWWRDIESDYGLTASIRGAEDTWGSRSGWHPHFHTLFFFDRRAENIDQESFTNQITQRFAQIANRNGYYVSPEFGVHVSWDQSKASSYPAKWGLDYELTKLPSKVAKSGDRFTPYQLLIQYALGGKNADVFRHRFIEHAQTMKGKKQLIWSKGAREKLGLGAEPTDQEIAESEVDAVQIILAKIRDDHWKKVLRRDVLGELLEVARRGNPQELRVYLEALGIELE
jgi:hypothetical protein